MAKTTKASGKFGAAGAAAATMVVRSSKTGRLVKVKGVGALSGDTLEIEKGVSLLKPIAKQALAQRARRREVG